MVYSRSSCTGFDTGTTNRRVVCLSVQWVHVSVNQNMACLNWFVHSSISLLSQSVGWRCLLVLRLSQRGHYCNGRAYHSHPQYTWWSAVLLDCSRLCKYFRTQQTKDNSYRQVVTKVNNKFYFLLSSAAGVLPDMYQALGSASFISTESLKAHLKQFSLDQGHPHGQVIAVCRWAITGGLVRDLM